MVLLLSASACRSRPVGGLPAASSSGGRIGVGHLILRLAAVDVCTQASRRRGIGARRGIPGHCRLLLKWS